jgi:serine protease Do
MKQLVSLVAAGMIGGLAAFGGMQLAQRSEPQATQLPGVHQARAVNYENPSASPLVDFREAAKKAMPAVVHITATKGDVAANERQQQNQPQGYQDLFDFFRNGGFGNSFGQDAPMKGTGSGVIYSEDGYIITNNHVVDFADEVEVTLNDDRKFKATVIGTDPTTDLAVLKIEQRGLPYLKVGDSDKVEIGEWALAVGNPFELNSTVTAGIVSGKGRNIGIIQDKYKIESFIQTDAAVNPGNSGGALVNANGELIGINTAILSRTGSYAGYSFAIPSRIVEKVVKDIIEYGSSQRAVIGIEIGDLNEAIAKEMNLNLTHGIVVTKVIDGGAGQYAGLLPDDVITAINGHAVKTGSDLIAIVGEKKPGDVVTLTISRNNKTQNLPVKLKAK